MGSLTSTPPRTSLKPPLAARRVERSRLESVAATESPSLRNRVERQRAPEEGMLLELKHTIDDTRRTLVGLQHSQKRWKAGFVITAALVFGFTAVGYAAISSNSTSISGLRGNVITHNESLFSYTDLIEVAGAAVTAAGTTSGGAVEMTTANGACAESGIAQADWFYQLTITEASVAAVTSGTYILTLYLDGVSQGALYIVQGTSDAANVEGAVCKWDLGTSLTASAAYTVKITV